MRREGKAGPFIPYEVRAQMGLARATTPVVARRRRRATTAVGARAKAYPLRRQRLRPGGNACARATTSAMWEGRFFTNTPNFSARTTTSVFERQRLRPCNDGCRVGGVFFHKHPKLQRSGDNAYVRAMTSALA